MKCVGLIRMCEEGETLNERCFNTSTEKRNKALEEYQKLKKSCLKSPTWSLSAFTV